MAARRCGGGDAFFFCLSHTFRPETWTMLDRAGALGEYDCDVHGKSIEERIAQIEQNLKGKDYTRRVTCSCV